MVIGRNRLLLSRIFFVRGNDLVAHGHHGLKGDIRLFNGHHGLGDVLDLARNKFLDRRIGFVLKTLDFADGVG